MESYSVQAILSAVDKGFSSTINSAFRGLSGIEKAASSATSSIMNIASGVGVFSAISDAVDLLSNSIDGAIDRYDTLNKYPRILKQLGYSAAEANQSTSRLKDGIQGLPTALDEVVSTSQRITVLTGNLGKATSTTLALNNAFISSSASVSDTSRGTEQYLQMLSKGNVDMMAWRTLQETMGYALRETSIELGIASGSSLELYDALQSGQITFDQFNDAMIECSERTGGFADMALKASAGIKTSWLNITTAIKSGVEGTIAAIDVMLKNSGLPKIEEMLNSVKSGINTLFGSYKVLDDGTKQFNGGLMEAVANFDNLKGLAVSMGTVLAGAFTLSGGLGYLNLLPNLFGNVINKARTLGTGIGEVIHKTEMLAQVLTGKLPIGSKSLKNMGKEASILAQKADGLKQVLTGTLDMSSKSFLKLNKEARQFIEKANGMRDSAVSFATKFQPAIQKVSAGLGTIIPDSVHEQFGRFANSASAAAATIKQRYTQLGNAIPDSIKSMASGIGAGINSSANVGMQALSGMVSALTSVMGVALKAVGPAAIVGLALVGLGVLQGQFGSQIDGFIQTATTKGPQIIAGLVSGIVSKIPELAKAGSSLLVGLMDMVTANIPAIASGGMQIVTALVQGIIDNLPQIMPATINLVTTIITTIVSLLPQIMILGLQLLSAIAEGVLSNIGLVTDSVVLIIDCIVNMITSNLPMIIALGVQILLMLAQGIIQALPAIIVAILNGLTQFIQTISSFLPVVLQAGVTLIMMLIQGIVQNLPQILTAGIQMIQSLIQGIAENLPQIVMAGFQIILMLITGILQMLPDILSAGWEIIKSLASGIAEAIPGILTAVIDGIKNLFTGLWDFITGKNKAGAEQTKTVMEDLANGIETSTSRASESAKMNTANMNLGVSTNASSMSSQVQAAMAGMNTGAVTETGAMSSNVQANIANMSTAGIANVDSLAYGIGSSAQNANAVVSGSYSNMSSNVSSSIGTLSATAAQVNTSVQGMANGINASMNTVSTTVTNTVNTAQSAISSGMNAITSCVSAGMLSFVNVVRNGMNNAVSAVRSGTLMIVSIINMLNGQMYSAGMYAMSGFTNGIIAGGSSAIAAANAIANQVAATMRKALDIHSPSKVTTEIGEYTGEGPAIGLLNMIPKVKRASDMLEEAMIPVNVADFSGTTQRYSFAGYGEITAKRAEGGTLTNQIVRELHKINERLATDGRTYVLEAHLNTDGRETAKVTAPFTEDELEKLQKKKRWINGTR